MLASSNIGVDCHYVGFYLVVEEMYGVIDQDAYYFSQVGILEYCFLLVDRVYNNPARLCGWVLIAANQCN